MRITALLSVASMKVVTIDIGNTRIKAARFEDDKLIDLAVLENAEALNRFLIETPLDAAFGSCVGKKPETLEFPIEWISPSNNNPIDFLINEPDTLGADRYVGILGVLKKFPKKDALLIDAGTCITYEYLKGNTYHGGAISPGINMRFQALHEYTDGLPKMESSNFTEYIGKDTQQAMNSGVLMGVMDEIQSRIDQWKQESEKGIVVITGGDAEFLGNHLKTGIFVEPLLLHYGLYYAHQFH